MGADDEVNVDEARLLEELREQLFALVDELPHDATATSWLREGQYRYRASLKEADSPAALAHCALQLEKSIKRRTLPKWWKHERPIWVQGVLATTRSSSSIAGCEPGQLLQQLVLTLGKLVRTLDSGVHGSGAAAAEGKRKSAGAHSSGARAARAALAYADAPVCDFFLRRTRRRLLPGEGALPDTAVAELRRLARRPSRAALGDAMPVEGGAEHAASRAAAAAPWTRLVMAELNVSRGGVGTLEHGRTRRPAVICAPTTGESAAAALQLELDESMRDVQGILLSDVCLAALDALRRCPHGAASLFEVPIEIAISSAPMPGYEQRITSQRLLDIPKIRSKARGAGGVAYTSLLEFRRDVRDMLQNAIDYHAPAQPAGRARARAAGPSFWVAQLAAELHAHFERELGLIVDELPSHALAAWSRRYAGRLGPRDVLPPASELPRLLRDVLASEPLAELGAAEIGALRDACLGTLDALHEETARRLLGAKGAPKAAAG